MIRKTVKRDNIREKMIQEMKEKSIFDQVKKFAYDYYDSSQHRNVFPTPEAIKDLKEFDESLPAQPGNASGLLEMLNRYGSPATVIENGGKYFGFVIGGTIPAAMAARWLSDFWDQNAGMFMTSPIASKLESVVEKWMRQLFGFSDEVVSGFVSGSTSAIFCALAAARYRILKRMNWDVNENGLFNAPRIRIVAGQQAHGAVLKSISMLGLGKNNIEWVEADEQGRIIADKIPDLDENTILILQAGNVNSGSFDPFEKICDKAVKAKAWIHIDGAFGLWAACSEKLNHLTSGMEKATSWSVDGHKTLNTPYDCGIVMCRDQDALVSALHITGSYLMHTEARDGYSYTPEMSRRARIVELWAALKYLGQEGIKELVDGLHERSVQFADEIRKAGFKVVNEVVFNQVLVMCENDEITTLTLELIQKTGECWCGSAMWNDRKVIRVSVSSWQTTADDISESVRAFESAYLKAKKIA
jgi:glutamate/tyrosine decarboxylase-like PLP-dependent enzyme